VRLLHLCGWPCRGAGLCGPQARRRGSQDLPPGRSQRGLVLPAAEAVALLTNWVTWAQASGLEPFVKLAATIVTYQQRIEAGLLHGLSNARVESLNTKIRLIIRRGFGFHDAKAITALAMLSLGGFCPPLRTGMTSPTETAEDPHFLTGSGDPRKGQEIRI
jgi:hypothetical protein